MGVTHTDKDRRDSVRCLSCGARLTVTLAQFLDLNAAGRLGQYHGTGYYIDGGWRPRKFYVQQCDTCLAVPHVPPPVTAQLAEIRELRQALELNLAAFRHVTVSEARPTAIQQAVECQMQRYEREFTPDFYHYHRREVQAAGCPPPALYDASRLTALAMAWGVE